MSVQYIYTFLCIISCFFIACGEEVVEPIVQEGIPKKEKVIPKKRQFIRPQTSYLRLRATPDQEAEVVETLPPDVLLEYLHDSTTFTTKINYRNKDYEAVWYKVRSSRTEEGWIYGGLVDFLGEVENKMILKEVEARELLEANEQSDGLSKKEKKEATEQVYESALQSYKNYLNQLNPSNINSVSAALEQFKIRLAEKSNTKTCDAAYIAFSKFHGAVIKQARLRSLAAYQGFVADLKRYHTVNMQQDAFTQQLEANAIRFGLEDGKLVLKKDFDAVFRVFFRECSSVMRAFMAQQELDEHTHFQEDGMLLIEPVEVARWVLSWNYFVAKHQDFVWYGQAQEYLERDLMLLLNGTANTPAFDDNQILKPAFKEAYSYITKNYPSSKIGQLFIEYTKLLEISEWKQSAATQAKVKQIMNTLVG